MRDRLPCSLAQRARKSDNICIETILNNIEQRDFETANQLLAEVETKLSSNDDVLRARQSYNAELAKHRTQLIHRALEREDALTTIELDAIDAAMEEVRDLAPNSSEELLRDVWPRAVSARVDILDAELSTLWELTRNSKATWSEVKNQYLDVIRTTSKLSAVSIELLDVEAPAISARMKSIRSLGLLAEALFHEELGDQAKQDADWTDSFESFGQAIEVLSSISLNDVREEDIVQIIGQTQLDRTLRRARVASFEAGVQKEHEKRLKSLEKQRDSVKGKAEKEQADAEIARARRELLNDSGELSSAWSECKYYVKENLLAAPRSAKFPWDADGTVILDDGSWAVLGHVDAQNLFGAMIRTVFVCTLIRTGEREFIVVDVAAE